MKRFIGSLGVLAVLALPVNLTACSSDLEGPGGGDSPQTGAIRKVSTKDGTCRVLVAKRKDTAFQLWLTLEDGTDTCKFGVHKGTYSRVGSAVTLTFPDVRYTDQKVETKDGGIACAVERKYQNGGTVAQKQIKKAAECRETPGSQPGQDTMVVEAVITAQSVVG